VREKASAIWNKESLELSLLLFYLFITNPNRYLPSNGHDQKDPTLHFQSRKNEKGVLDPTDTTTPR
jgi:hypothetical protein